MSDVDLSLLSFSYLRMTVLYISTLSEFNLVLCLKSFKFPDSHDRQHICKMTSNL